MQALKKKASMFMFPTESSLKKLPDLKVVDETESKEVRTSSADPKKRR